MAARLGDKRGHSGHELSPQGAQVLNPEDATPRVRWRGEGELEEGAGRHPA